MKFRIVKNVSNLKTHNECTFFYVEIKRFFLWRKVGYKGIYGFSLNTFITFEEAEQYLIKKLMSGDGYYIQYGNIYIFKRYSLPAL